MKDGKLSAAAQAVLRLAVDFRIDEAVRAADEALAVDPDDADVLVAKGNALDLAEEYGQALKCYKRALRIDPHHLPARFDYADHFWYVGRRKRAQEKFMELLDLIQRTEAGRDPVASDVLDDVAFLAGIDDFPELTTKVGRVRAALARKRPG